MTLVSEEFLTQIDALVQAEIDRIQSEKLDLETPTTQFGNSEDTVGLGILLAISITLLGVFAFAGICLCVFQADARAEEARLQRQKVNDQAQEEQPVDIFKSRRNDALAANSGGQEVQNKTQVALVADETNMNISILLKPEDEPKPKQFNSVRDQAVSAHDNEDVTVDGVGVKSSLGILRPGPEPAKSSRLFDRQHTRKRSQYLEAEVHSSEATVQSDDRPSFRLDKSIEMGMGLDASARKSMHLYTANATQNVTPTNMYLSNNDGEIRIDSLQ